jgi:ABC-2 type transport system permease protein
MNNINGILAIWYREYKVFLRERSRVISSIISPLLWLLIFGGGLGSSLMVSGINYQTFIFPGILAQSVLFTSVFFGVYIVWDRKIDFLKEVLVAPISRTSMFLGKVIGGATDSLIQSLILLILGLILGNIGIIPGLHLTIFSILASLLILFITTSFFVSVGLIIGSRMESPEGFQLISSFLLFPVFFLSGALFSIDKLPVWLAPLTFINPLTYSVDALRKIILGISHFPLYIDSGILIVYTMIIIVAGIYAFKKMKI